MGLRRCRMEGVIGLYVLNWAEAVLSEPKVPLWALAGAEDISCREFGNDNDLSVETGGL
jgi:hypothetical protein